MPGFQPSLLDLDFLDQNFALIAFSLKTATDQILLQLEVNARTFGLEAAGFGFG
jgi:hypothetical protein